MPDTRFREVLETTSDIVYVQDLEGRILSVNNAAERLFGVPREDAIGLQIANFIVPEHRERARAATMQKLQHGGTTTYTIDVIAASGRRVPLEVSTQIVYENGKPVAVQGIARDVTERLQASEAVAQSERYFRALIENALDAITVVNDDGSVRYQSPSVERILGYSPEERRGRSLFEIGHPDDVPVARRLFEQLRRESNDVVHCVFRARNKAGEWRHIEIRARNLLHDPSVQGHVLNWRDVTEHVAANRQVNEREHFFRALIERSSDILIVADKDFTIEYVSPAIETVMGYKPEEAIGTRGLGWVHPDDEPRVRPVIEAVFEKGEPSAGWVARALDKDGNIHVFDVRARNLLDDPLIKGVILDARDITETRRTAEALQETEQRFRKILETAAEGVAIRDINGRITFANERFARLFGYSSVANVIGLNVFDIVAPEDRALMIESSERRKQSGMAEQMDLHFVRRDGSRFPVLLSASPLYDSDGNYAGSLGMITDLTERKQLEDQLRQSQKIEAVGQLAGGVAHDFNNLLTAIRGHVELLLEEISAESPLRHDVDEIRKASERAASLTQQLLAFSRRQVLQPRIIQIDKVVSEIQSLMRRLIGEDIRLSTELRCGDVCVRADRSQIEQVLMNLAVNGRDAMPDGGTLIIATDTLDIGEAFVRLNPGARHGWHVRLSVRDTGSGMDAETLSHVFEPFFTTKGLGKGTGLGLATVYGVVKQSGGYIRVESERDEGTNFEIYLPVVQQVEEAPGVATPVESRRGNGETILVVEDEDAVRALACRILRKQGYNVLQASNGTEALEIAKGKDPIDIVLTDVVMPHMGGRELSERLHSVKPNAKVLFMSGYTDDALLTRGVQNTGRFLEKPFSPEALAAKIREVLESD